MIDAEFFLSEYSFVKNFLFDKQEDGVRSKSVVLLVLAAEEVDEEYVELKSYDDKQSSLLFAMNSFSCLSIS